MKQIFPSSFLPSLSPPSILIITFLSHFLLTLCPLWVHLALIYLPFLVLPCTMRLICTKLYYIHYGDHVLPIPNLPQSLYVFRQMLIILTCLWLHFLWSNSFFWLGLSYIACYSLSQLARRSLAISLPLGSLTCYVMSCFHNVPSTYYLSITCNYGTMLTLNHCYLVHIN